MALTLLLSGCKGATFTMTGSGSKVSIEVSDAEDGAYAESFDISVGKDRYVNIASALDKGQLQIEFVEITKITRADKSDEIIYGDIVATETVGPNETKDLEIPRDDYVLQLTAIGNTNGKVTVEVKKK